MSRDVPVQSVRKALDILTLLAFDDLDRAGIPLSTVARRMAMPANTAHNLLKTMAACGYVAQTRAGAYTVGPRCLALGRLNSLLSGAAAQAIPRHMESLVNELGESVVFAALVDGRRAPLWHASGRQAVRVDPAAAETRGPFAQPTGRVLAAYAEPEEVARLIERAGFPGADWEDICSRPALEAALERVRNRGFEAIVPDDRDLASFAVPVRNGQDLVTGALGCYAPLFRCGPERQAEILQALRQKAEILSRET